MIGKFFERVAERFRTDWPQISISGGVHVVLILLLMLFVVKTGTEPARLQQLVELEEIETPPLEKELPDLAEDTVVLDKPLSIMSEAPGAVSESTELLKGDPSPTNEAAMAREISNKSRNRPMTSSTGKLRVGSLVNGLKGTSDTGGGGGGRGAVDAITREILRNLKKGPVLVAWVMDPTESMATTRGQIADRFDNIYKELGSVGAIRDDSLLNAIVSCGVDTKFMTEKPTADVEVLAKAVRSIKDDGTGTENFFDGVMKTASKYRKFQAGGKRTFMIIVVTDEVGDDQQNIDEAVNTVKRNKTLVYVLGPGASFAYPEMLVSTTTSSGESIEGYITRGPSTRDLEILKIPFNTTPYKDAWGPYGLSYISRESGAIYWILEDGRLSGPDYDLNTLAPYKPFYGTIAEYQKDAGKSEIRRAVMEVCRQGNQLPQPKKTEATFLAQDAAKKTDELQKEIQPFLTFARGATGRMEGADSKRTEETNPAWLANFDLTIARLLQGRVIAEEYVDALNKVRSGGVGAANAWQISETGTLDAGGASAAPEGVTGSLATAPTSVLAEKAKFYYERVIKEHPNTPWAEVARAEMGRAYGFDAVPITVQVQQAGPGGNRPGDIGDNRVDGKAPPPANTPPPKPKGPPPKL